MNTNRLKLVWENGVSLSEAFAHFADDNAIRFKDHTKGLDPKFRGTKAENVEQVFKAVGALSNIMLDIASVKTKQREWLFIELDKKRLMAIGYKSSDSGTIEISIVPEPLLNPAFVDWEQSAISGLGFEFIDVRINLYRKFNLPKDVTKPIGRPSGKERIWQIINDIGLDKLHLKCGNNKTAIANEIYRFGKKQIPNNLTEFSPTVQTIIRHYNSYLENNSN